MAEYIDRSAFLKQKRAWYCKNCIRRTNSKGKIVYEIGEAPCRACEIGDVLDDLEDVPAADVVERKDAIPIEWMVGKLTGHPELSYTFTDGIISVIDMWNKENGIKHEGES